MNMKKIAMVFLCLLLSAVAFAQSANLLSMARAELDKRGLNEMEVRTRLLENGIDVDSIPPTEYANYQGRVLAILNQMQAEKNNVAASTSANAGTEEAANASQTITPNEVPITTVGEAAAEKALEDALEENQAHPTDRPSDIYGHGLFAGKSMGVFRTTDGAQAPDTYVLGVGDEVHISIFGSSQTEIHQRIAADGSIQPAGSTKIFLKGLNLAQGRTAIKTKLAQFYSFRPDQIAVTIATARTLTVSIYGEVGVQGGFTLSALNTAFNALAAAGGPTDIGSVRNIQRSRSGKTERLDLYKYMTGKTGDVLYDLQNGDVLFVPVAEKIVTLRGAVNRPMRYEIVEGESLKELIAYAGGVSSNANPDFVQIERFENGEKKLLEYNLGKVLDGRESVHLTAGDIIWVQANNEPLENYVSIVGDVFYEGQYDLRKNGSLKTLIQNAKPRYTARKDYLFVERHLPDRTVQVLTVPYPGTDGNPDFLLQARDEVRILTLSSYRDVANISVSGAVREPFTRQFGLNDKMSVSQAIEYAGGLRSTTYPVAYIFRQDVTNPEKMEYIQINLNKDGDTLLQPGDSLNVYDNTTYTNVGEVRVSGAVKNTVNVPFDSSLSVRDLLTMAGGMATGAAYDRVEVFRMNISTKDQVKFDMVTIAVDEDFNPVGTNFQLRPYDHIVVRRTPDFSTGRTVELNGRVRYPGTYVLSDSRTQLSDIIALAGGLLDDAEPSAVLFRTYRTRGSISIDLSNSLRNKGNTRHDPILLDGDVINVMRRENTVTIRETGTRLAQYIPEDFAASQKTVVYQGRRSAKWYIKHNAGGFTRDADRNSVTVTKPNGQSESTTRFLWMRFYPKVEPGSVISLNIDMKKREKMDKPKEPVEWDKIAAGTLSSLTSIVSMILLIERLN